MDLFLFYFLQILSLLELLVYCSKAAPSDRPNGSASQFVKFLYRVIEPQLVELYPSRALLENALFLESRSWKASSSKLFTPQTIAIGKQKTITNEQFEKLENRTNSYDGTSPRYKYVYVYRGVDVVS